MLGQALTSHDRGVKGGSLLGHGLTWWIGLVIEGLVWLISWFCLWVGSVGLIDLVGW